MDDGSEPQPGDFLLFAMPEAGHQEDSAADPGLAQWNSFVEAGDAQPLGAFGLQSMRALHRAVTIGIGLHHRADGYLFAYMALDRAKVLAKLV